MLQLRIFNIQKFVFFLIDFPSFLSFYQYSWIYKLCGMKSLCFSFNLSSLRYLEVDSIGFEGTRPILNHIFNIFINIYEYANQMSLQQIDERSMSTYYLL